MIDTIIMFFGAAATIALALFAFHSSRKALDEARDNHNLTSVNIATHFMSVFIADKDMQSVYYDIEHGRFKYDGTGSLQEDDKEAKMDKLLRHFFTLAVAWKIGFVKKDTLRLACYYALKTLNNEGVQRYMQKVCNASAKKHPHLGKHPYSLLMEMRDKLKHPPTQ